MAFNTIGWCWEPTGSLPGQKSIVSALSSVFPELSLLLNIFSVIIKSLSLSDSFLLTSKPS